LFNFVLKGQSNAIHLTCQYSFAASTCADPDTGGDKRCKANINHPTGIRVFI
jgi:hypothetical protein